MKKKLLIFSLAVIAGFTTWAQSEATTNPKGFSIAKEVKPPIWEIQEAVSFVEPSGNNAIDANETCKILMKVKNVGFGDGIGLTATITATGAISGLSYSSKPLSTIKVGEIRTVEFPVSASMNTIDGSVEFTLKIDEPQGFGTDKQFITVNTKQFVAPMIEVVDYSVTGENQGELKKMQAFDLQLLLQNTLYGTGENVTVTLSIPENVYLLNGEAMRSFALLKPGETQSLVYRLIVNNNFSGESIPLKISVSERYGKYAKDKNIVLNINQPLAANKIAIQSIDEAKPNIVIGSLRSDVDKNIPVNSVKNPNRFALIIGNEDYHSYQPGLQSESDVAFAVNDASVFKEYCSKSLGIEDRNIILLTNATAAVIKQEIARICKLVSLKGTAGEFVFYYAGHGFPDENSKEPYLIPVDVTAGNLTSAIKLYDLYQQLSATGAGKITVFMDACFSGGGRDAGLMAARGIKVVPKKESLTGNLVVFSATEEDQVALPYREKQHGMFTYFLLKKLQETNASCSYSDLYNYIKDSVSEYSLRENKKVQTPAVNTSNAVHPTWEQWGF